MQEHCENSTRTRSLAHRVYLAFARIDRHTFWAFNFKCVLEHERVRVPSTSWYCDYECDCGCEYELEYE